METLVEVVTESCWRCDGAGFTVVSGATSLSSYGSRDRQHAHLLDTKRTCRCCEGTGQTPVNFLSWDHARRGDIEGMDWEPLPTREAA